jgi:hypothetical protein
MKIATSDRNAMAVFKAAFPETNFRSVDIEAFHGPMNLNSYWDSGYRDYYAIVRLADNARVQTIAQNGTMFDSKNFELSELPAGFAIACHCYAGVRQYGKLYFNQSDLVPLLPPSRELPWIEKAVLCITYGLKSFARKEEAARMGIKPDEWDATIPALVTKGLVNKAGAITNEGRNIVAQLPGCQYGSSQNFGELAKEGARGCAYRREARMYGHPWPNDPNIKAAEVSV